MIPSHILNHRLIVKVIPNTLYQLSGRQLRALRDRLDLSLAQASVRLDISCSHLYNLEMDYGSKQIGEDLLLRIICVYRMDEELRSE